MQPSLATQVASFLGAMVILIAYIGHQLRWMDAKRPAYSLMNAAGSAVLAYIAFRPFQVGFFIMETAWVVVSLYALFRHEPRGQH